MALKGFVDSLDDLPDPIKEHYVPMDDGKGFKLDASGMVSAKKLDEFRTNNHALMSENASLKENLKKFDGFDPAELTQIKARLGDEASVKILQEKGVDGLLAMKTEAIKGEYETRIKTLEGDNGKLKATVGVAQEEISDLILTRSIQDTATALKIELTPEATQFVVGAAKAHGWKVGNDRKPIAQKGDGQLIYGADSETPLKLKDWMTTDLAKAAPFLFPKASGSGAPGSTGGGGGQVLKRSKMTTKEKSAFIAQHGQAKYLALPDE